MVATEARKLQPRKIFDTAQGITAQVIEKVTAANPSQIIAVNQAVDAQAKESLEKIAPTTLKPEGFKDWQIPWDKQVETIAKAVGKQAEGEQLIEETKGPGEVQARPPGTAGKACSCRVTVRRKNRRIHLWRRARSIC